MEMLSAADDSSSANPSSVKSDDSSPRHESGRGSPPPKCAICLGTCRNKSFTDSCLHQFCFKCLLTWSKVKAECPLCKQNFKSIIHNVRSNHQYDEYTVEQQHEETTQTIDIDNLTNTTRRFRYRTTVTLPRRDTLAFQQMLMHYPFMADVFPLTSPAPRAPPARRRRSPTTFRRTVYRHNLWARPLPDFTGRFRDCTPEFYRYNDSQMHRLVPWLNRELSYLLNENIGHISYVMSHILELLPRYHISSTEFREAMQRYFGERTEHFLHELYCFASTPYDMTGYDRNVQYTTDSRISTMVNEVLSSSESDASVDSDIVMVSSSHAEPPAAPAPAPLPAPAGPSRLPAPVYPHHYIPQPPADNVIPIETISQSDSDSDDEVMVVGYIKPPQDRTPEVVDLLGSDSDVIVQDAAPPSPRPAPRSAPLVKLSLKRCRARDESSDDAAPRPAPRRKRRARSRATATTSDTERSTPSPSRAWSPSDSYTPSASPLLSPSPSPTPTPSPASRASSSSLFTDSSTASYGSYQRRKRLTKKKTKRKSRSETAEREKKRSSRSRRKIRNTTKEETRESKSKRKSHSGKGVKSSKKSRSEAETRPVPSCTPPLPRASPGPPDPSVPPVPPGPSVTNVPPVPPVPLDQPGPSLAAPPRRSHARHAHSHESRRLKSVVNVMFKGSGDSSPGVSTPTHGSSLSQSNDDEWTKAESLTPPPVSAEPYQTRLSLANYSDTDSDDLPLNMSVQKTYTNL